MSATEETKTTTMFDGKQEGFGKYRIQLTGEFLTKGAQAALGPKFEELLLESEAVSGQTANQSEAVKHHITGMGILIKTHKSEDILVMLESTVSDDWPYGRVNLAMDLFDKMFCPKDTMAKALQTQRLGELTLKDY